MLDHRHLAHREVGALLAAIGRQMIVHDAGLETVLSDPASLAVLMAIEPRADVSLARADTIVGVAPIPVDEIRALVAES